METENKEQVENLDVVMDIDMDALAGPDAGVKEGDMSIPGEGASPEGGPILEENDMIDPINETGEKQYITPGGLQDMDAIMDKELGVETENVENIDNNSEPTENVETPQSDASTSEELPYYNAPFDELKDRLGEDFEMPEGVNEENYMDKLLDVIYKNTNFDEYVHEDVRELNDYLKDGGSFQNYINEYKGYNSDLTASNYDLVRSKLSKESPDWTDEKLNTIVKKMDNSGILEVEAERIRKDVRASQANIKERAQENTRAQRQQSQAEMKDAREAQINEAVDAFNQLDSVYGLPVSKAERQEFRETFTQLVTPDEKGVAPLYTMLQSNDNIAKVAFILSKGDSAVRSALTNAKESTKEAFLEKLDPTPKTTQKSGMYEPGQINLDALASPERARY